MDSSPKDADIVAAGVHVVPSDGVMRKGAHGTLEKLVTLHGTLARIDHLAGEALQLVLEAFGVRLGAILIYEKRTQSLVLAAESGLGAMGRERLKRVRRADPKSWDMPLHGLLNERAYLIDDPVNNRFVPELVDEGNGRLECVACIPIYRQRVPVGSFVLIAKRGQRLTEAEIRLANVPLRYVGTIIDDAVQRDGLSRLTEESESNAPRRPRPRLAGAEELPQTILLTEIAEDDDAPVAPTETVRGAGTADHQLPEARAEIAALRATVVEIEARERKARDEIEELHEELSSVIAERDRRAKEWEEVQQRSLESVREQLETERDEALEVVRRERDELARSVESLTRAARAERADAAERTAEAERIQEIEAELRAVRQTSQEVARQLRQALEDVKTRDQRIDELEEDRTRLEGETAAAREQLQQGVGAENGADALLVARASEIAALENRLRSAKSKIEARERTIEDLETGNAQLAADEAASRDNLTRANERVTNLEARMRSADAEATELAVQLERARASEEANGRQIELLESAKARVESERDAASQQASAFGAEVANLRESLARHEEAAAKALADQEAAAQSARAAHESELRAEREALERARADWEAQAARAREESDAAAEERERLNARIAELEEGMRLGSTEASAARDREQTVAQEAAAWKDEAETLRATVTDLEQALEAARADVSELEDRRSAAERAGEGWREEADTFRERVTAMAKSLEVIQNSEAKARSRVDELEGEKRFLEQKLDGAEQLRREAAQSAKQIADLEQALERATTKATSIGAREAAATQEAVRLEAESEELQASIAALDGEAAAARADAQKWQQNAEDLARRVSLLEERVAERDALRIDAEKRSRRLETELADFQSQASGGASSVKQLEAQLRAAHSEAARARAEGEQKDRYVAELERQHEEQAQRVESLEAAVARLEAGRTHRIKDEDSGTGASGKSKSGTSGASRQARGAKRSRGARAAAAPALPGERVAVVEPTAGFAEPFEDLLGEHVQVIDPSGDLARMARAVADAEPTIVAVNLGSRGPCGGFNVLPALQEAGVTATAKVWAYVAPQQATRGVPVGQLSCVPSPISGAQLLEACKLSKQRGARVLSVGLEMDDLMAVREQLTQMGASLSMAWDSKQGHELLEVVHPNVVVINLDLARGDGYRALGRLAAVTPRPKWVLCGGTNPPVEAGSLVVGGATQSAAGAFLPVEQLATALVEDMKAAAPEASNSKRPRRSAAGSNAGRMSRKLVRRDPSVGSQRRMPYA